MKRSRAAGRRRGPNHRWDGTGSDDAIETNDGMGPGGDRGGRHGPHGRRSGVAVLALRLKAWRYGCWFVRRIVRQFRDDGCTVAAAALTLTTMIAVVPFFAVVYRILSLLPEFSGVGDTITSFVFETFLPGSSDVVLEKVREFSARANELTIVGVGIVFLSTMLLLMRMEASFNRIWHVANTRTGLVRFLSYWGILALGVPMIGIAVIAASYDFGLDYIAPLRGSPVMEGVREAVPPVAMALTFTLLYYAVPSCRVRIHHALFGGILTTVLLTFAKEVFGWAVPWFQHEVIYGVFAALPLFVIGLNLVWVLILAGAICVRTLSLPCVEQAWERGHPALVEGETPSLPAYSLRASAAAPAAKTPWEDEPDGVPAAVKCARVLELLHQAHLAGNAVTDADILRAVPMTRTERGRIFDVLHEGRWLRPTENKGWALGRSLERITLWELFLKLPDGIAEECVDGDSTVEQCFRAFLADGAVHLDVSLAEVTANQSEPDVRRD